MISPGDLRRVFQLGHWFYRRYDAWYKERHADEIEGRRQLQFRNWDEAERHLLAALAELPAGPSTKRARLLLQIGEAQRWAGKSAEAEASLREALPTVRGSYAHQLQCLDLLGLVMSDRQRWAEAAGPWQEALKLVEASPRPDSANLAHRYRQLSQAYTAIGRAAEAGRCRTRALDLLRSLHGDRHAEVANLLVEQGEAAAQTGSPTVAVELLTQALAIHEAVCGPVAPEVARDLRLLGRLQEQAGDVDGAAARYERAISIQERTTGGQPAELIGMMVSLARAYLRQGRLGPALERLQQAQRMAGPDADGHGVAALETLGYAYGQMGRHSEAEPVYATACAYCTELAAAQPARFQPQLIHLLERHAWTLAALRQQPAAQQQHRRAQVLRAAAGNSM